MRREVNMRLVVGDDGYVTAELPEVDGEWPDLAAGGPNLASVLGQITSNLKMMDDVEFQRVMKRFREGRR